VGVVAQVDLKVELRAKQIWSVGIFGVLDRNGGCPRVLLIITNPPHVTNQLIGNEIYCSLNAAIYTAKLNLMVKQVSKYTAAFAKFEAACYPLCPAHIINCPGIHNRAIDFLYSSWCKINGIITPITHSATTL